MQNKFVDPFYPIIIRNECNKIIIKNHVFPRSFTIYSLQKELELGYSIEGVEKIFNNECFIINIDMKRLYINTDKGIGFNFCLYKLENERIIEAFTHIPLAGLPVLLKY